MIYPLFAVIAPFLIWPIELVFPYPYIVEEIVKLAIIYFVVKDNNLSKTNKLQLTILNGILFAFSEDVLYLFNIALVGSLGTFFTRILLTIPLHVLTSVLILSPALKNRKLIFLGFIPAVILHYLFNLWIQLYL